MELRQKLIRWVRTLGEFKKSVVRFIASIATILAFTCVVSGLLLCVEESTRDAWIGEGRIVESLSAWLYVVVAGLLTLTGMAQWRFPAFFLERQRFLHPFLLATVCLCFAAREWDFHSRFTGGSVLKTSFFLESEHGWTAKLVTLWVLLAIAMLLVRVATRYYGPVRRRLLNGELLGVLPFTAVALAAFSKGVDGGMGTLRRIGWTVSYELHQFAWGMEEISELFISCVFLATFAEGVAQIFCVRCSSRRPCRHGGPLVLQPRSSGSGVARIGLDEPLAE
ncbi:MAG: hypothetical protein AAGD07_09810 [Planctomycetota bacterium]